MPPTCPLHSVKRHSPHPIRSALRYPLAYSFLLMGSWRRLLQLPNQWSLLLLSLRSGAMCRCEREVGIATCVPCSQASW